MILRNETRDSSMQYKSCLLLLTVPVLSVYLLCLVFLKKESAPKWHANRDTTRNDETEEDMNSGVKHILDEIRKPTTDSPTEPSNYRSLSLNTTEITNALAELTRLIKPSKKFALLTQTLDDRPSVKAGTTSAQTELTHLGALNQNVGNVNEDPDKLSSPYIHTLKASEQCSEYTDDKKLVKGRHPKIILYDQTSQYFPEPRGGFKGLCSRPTAGPCVLTFDKTMRRTAHAVVFHASRLGGKKPPFQKVPGQVWIARGLEAPSHWNPDFRSPGWKGVIDWTMTYRPDSEIFSPVGALVRIPQPPRENFTKIAREKTRSIAWFVSDCDTLSKRESYVKQMKKYIDVDIYGECGPLKCKKHQSECDEMLSKTYRFYLAFENTFCPYYVTEKFLNKFRDDDQSLHLIPVVRGGADYRKYFPDGTFINAADFASPRELSEHLNKLGKDLHAYAAMLERKSHFGKSRCLKLESWCRMCDKLHDETPTSRVYDDLGAWWDQAACLNRTDVHDVISV